MNAEKLLTSPEVISSVTGEVRSHPSFGRPLPAIHGESGGCIPKIPSGKHRDERWKDPPFLMGKLWNITIVYGETMRKSAFLMVKLYGKIHHAINTGKSTNFRLGQLFKFANCNSHYQRVSHPPSNYWDTTVTLLIWSTTGDTYPDFWGTFYWAALLLVVGSISKSTQQRDTPKLTMSLVADSDRGWLKAPE